MRAQQWAGGRRVARRAQLALLTTAMLLLAACGTTGDTTDDAGASEAGASETGSSGSVSVVATTTILGDVAGEVVGDLGEVVTLMPAGADPHAFEPSAQELETLQGADLIVANGGNLEESLIDAIEEAESAGVQVFNALDQVETLEFTGEDAHDHDHDGEESHSGEEGHSDGDEHSSEDAHSHDGEEDHSHDDEHSSEDAHSHEGEEGHSDEGGDEHGHTHGEGSDDPHFWMDPTRTAAVATALGADLASMSGDSAFAEQGEAYASELTDLDTQVEDTLSAVSEDSRTLVTNHDALRYFADRYDFEIAGTVIPDVSTGAEPSAEDIAELSATIRDEQVGAIFAETTQPDRLAETVAGEVGGDVAVVQLFTGSLGEEGTDGDTYVGMMETNAQRIADGLSDG